MRGGGSLAGSTDVTEQETTMEELDQRSILNHGCHGNLQCAD